MHGGASEGLYSACVAVFLYGATDDDFRILASGCGAAFQHIILFFPSLFKSSLDR